MAAGGKLSASCSNTSQKQSNQLNPITTLVEENIESGIRPLTRQSTKAPHADQRPIQPTRLREAQVGERIIPSSSTKKAVHRMSGGPGTPGASCFRVKFSSSHPEP